MAGNPYMAAGFVGGGAAPRETFDSMYDEAAGVGIAGGRAADFFGHLKTPSSVADLASAKAVDYDDMYATIAHGGDSLDYETGLARISRARSHMRALKAASAGTDPSVLAIYSARDGMIPEERSVNAPPQVPRPIGR